MDKYSKKKIEAFVEKVKDKAVNVYVGMREDWYWTSEEVWNKEQGWMECWNTEEGDDIELAGIKGSTWATPYAEADDGSELLVSTYVGQNY